MNTETTTPLEAFRMIERAVDETYKPEGARIWWINFGKADSAKRKRMIRAVMGAW
ncbi:hypothetical protein [Rathayibacter sp. AY2B9]|uniref:hypothetical protein n=1 Tax=Rathayibacter sp. AY2B9 TaxID=2080572 RepID=UPI0015E309DE|nr:hypothetical protein [Rathayibacter sp. AY2B9]